MKVCSHCRRCHDDSVSSCTEGHPPLSESRSGSCELVTGYRLEQQLEAGLKGEIYLAREKMSGRTCLIRLLPLNETIREQFLYEARLAATLFHPNIADVYEADALPSGELYVVSEEPEGQTARELLKATGTPPLLTAIQIVREAAEAVHALHLKGLIHRAINPENIVVGKDPEGDLHVRVQNPDFGGIAQRAIISNKFLIDSALGSIRYFAPEQCSGEPESIKTDIYALGVVLYEMIAGVPPFDAPKAAALIQMHRTLAPPEVRIDNFDLRMLLTHTLMESLQKHGRTRQSSANAFARQLRHMEQLATHVSTPPPAVVVADPPSRAASASTAAATSPAKSSTAVNPDYAAFLRTVATMDETAPEPVTPEPLPTAFVGIDPIDLRPASTVEEKEMPPKTVETDLMAGTTTESEPAPEMHLRGPLDDVLEVPDSLTDAVSVAEADHEFAPAPVVEALPTEEESLEAEPAWIDRPRLPILEPPVEELVQAEMAMPEPVLIEAESGMPEPVQMEPELSELPVAPSKSQITEPAFARATPAKIVWADGLEDDIPSEEDVQAALLEEQLPEIVAEPIVPEPVQIEAKPPEIEIVRPEPQMAETMFARATPAKIVCDELDDDIPSLEDVEAALIEAELAPVVAESVISEPLPVEAKLPEIEAVRPEPQVIQSIPVRPVAAKVVCEVLDDDIPSEADVQAAILEEEPARPAVVPDYEYIAPRPFWLEGKPKPAVDPVAITIPVEPVKRAEKSRPIYTPAEAPIFAAYSGRSRPSVNINYRTVLVSLGTLAAAVMLLVGRVIVNDSLGDHGPVKTVEAETTKGQQQQPIPPAQTAPQNVALPKQEPESKSVESTPFAGEELDAKQLKPLPGDEGGRLPRQMFFPTPSTKPVENDVTAKTSDVTPRVQPPPAGVAKNAKNDAKPLPFSPSVVIPYKGPQRAKTNNEKDCADQQAAQAPSKTSQTRAANITRPRVVRDPQN